MRGRLRLGVTALAAVASGCAAAAAGPQPLSFTVEGDRYVVPEGGLTRVDETDGLTFCLAPAVAEALTDFTHAHTGETVAIAIGDTDVFHLRIVKPYDGGCINWPLHPVVAKNYRQMLTGEGASE